MSSIFLDGVFMRIIVIDGPLSLDHYVGQLIGWKMEDGRWNHESQKYIAGERQSTQHFALRCMNHIGWLAERLN